MQHAEDSERITSGERKHAIVGATPQSARSASPTAPPPRGATILIVENEINNRRLIEQILGFAGYHYISAANGLEALTLVDHAPVDLVLLDLSMPVLDGYRTSELMRERHDASALPIIAVTAHAMNEDRERALRSGCNDYLIKPFRPAELLGIVGRWLTRVRPNQMSSPSPDAR